MEKLEKAKTYRTMGGFKVKIIEDFTFNSSIYAGVVEISEGHHLQFLYDEDGKILSGIEGGEKYNIKEEWEINSLEDSLIED